MDQILVFSCGGEEFGLPVEVVREVRRRSEVFPLPQAPAFVEGVIHLRGHPVAVVDLAGRLGISRREKNKKNRIVIVKSRDIMVGITVDEVTEVLDVSDKTIEATPAIALPVSDGFVKKISDLKGRLIFILELEELLSREETDHLRQMKSETGVLKEMPGES